MTKQLIAAATLAMLANSAAAVEFWRQSSNGVDYLVTVNNHGWKLQSRSGETVYLGRTCDAQHSDAGTGWWTWANGGFCAEFRTSRICFERQELPGNVPDECWG